MLRRLLIGRKTGGLYIPHPSNWLLQQRWEDDLSDISSASEARVLSQAKQQAQKLKESISHDHD